MADKDTASGWHRVVHFKLDVLDWSIVPDGTNDYQTCFGEPHPIPRQLYDDGDVNLWTQQFDAQVTNMARNWRRFPQYVKKIQECCVAYVAEAPKLAASKDLAPAFKRFRAIYARPVGTLVPIIATAGEGLAQALRQKVNGRLSEDKLQQLSLALSTPREETATSLYNQRLLRLAVKVKSDPRTAKLLQAHQPDETLDGLKKSNPNVFREITALSEEFGYLGKLFLSRPPWGPQEILAQLKDAISSNPAGRLAELGSKRQEGLRQAESALQELSFDPEARWIAENLREAIYIRTWRLEQVNKGNRLVAPLLDAIAKKADITYDELIHCTVDEIEAFLDEGKPLPIALARERMDGFVADQDGDRITITPSKPPGETVKKGTNDQTTSEPVMNSKLLERFPMLAGQLKRVVKVQEDVYTNDCVNKGMGGFGEYSGLGTPYTGEYGHPQIYANGDIYFSKKTCDIFTDLLAAKPFELIPAGFELMQVRFNELAESGRNLGLQPVENLSTEKLGELYRSHLQVNLAATSFMGFPLFVEYAVTRLLKEELSKKGAGAGSYFSNLTVAQKESEIIREQIDLLKLAIKAKSLSPSEFKEALQAHCDKYSWLGIRFAEGKAFTLQDYEAKVKDVLGGDPATKLKEMHERSKQAKQAFQQALRELNPSTELRKLIDLAQDAVYLRTWRLERLNLSNFLARPFYDELAKRMGLDYYEFIYLLPSEVEGFLKRGSLPVSVGELRERRKGYVSIPDKDGKLTIFTGKDMAPVLAMIEREASGPRLATTKWRYTVKVLVDPLSEELMVGSLWDRYPKVMCKPPYLPEVRMPIKYVLASGYYGSEAYASLVRAHHDHPHQTIPHSFGLVYRYCEALMKIAERISKVKVDKLARAGLGKLFFEYLRAYDDALLTITEPIYIDDAISTLLRELLRKRGLDEKRVEEYLSILTVPSKNTKVQELQSELTAIAMKIPQKHDVRELFRMTPEEIVKQLPRKEPVLHKEITQLTSKYAWSGLRFLEGRPLELKDFVERMQHLLEEDVTSKAEQLERGQLLGKERFAQAIKELKLTADERRLVDYAREVVFLRTHRLEQYNQANYLVYPLLQAVAKEMDLDAHSLAYLSQWEIGEFFKSGSLPDHEVISQRLKAYGLVTLADGTIYLTQGDGLKALSETEEEPTQAGEVKGQVAYPGRVAGEVVIINGPQDFHKFSRGKVMVTQMTTPDFVPVMEKARAVVTDIGGITTHAAIVSRELGVTCIIGTERGTKVFKDGDLVLVDTDASTVRKLTREEFQKLESELVKEAKQAVKAEKARVVQEVELRGDLIMDFSITNKRHLPLVGGKGASLGEMFGKFPVPDGFIVTTNAYKAFIEESGVGDEIHHLLERLDPEDTAALEKTAKQIEDSIVKAKMPAEAEEAILYSYQKLGGGFVAVRSSATAEDLPGASFAGLQATFLNVKGKGDVVRAVKECWASLFTPRAILYRSVKKFEHEKVHMAVVIQQMVDSKKAGVMFTANPITKNLDEAIIEGSWGLGESVVSGQVTPDGFVVDKLDLTIKERHPGEKRTSIERDLKTGKNVHRQLPPEEARRVCLSDHEVQELTRIGKHVEGHYGNPQDIEWAIDAQGKFYVLQSRPITTL